MPPPPLRFLYSNSYYKMLNHAARLFPAAASARGSHNQIKFYVGLTLALFYNALGKKRTFGMRKWIGEIFLSECVCFCVPRDVVQKFTPLFLPDAHQPRPKNLPEF